MIQLDETDKKLLNAVQLDFPLVHKPFEELGKSLGLKEDEVIRRIKRLCKEGAIRRIGPDRKSVV
jgi:DNA-binding Lrp family transcriptional regulator